LLGTIEYPTVEWSVVDPHGMMLLLRLWGSIAQLHIFPWQHAQFAKMQCYRETQIAICEEIVYEVDALQKLSKEQSNQE
jgi:hypothetical protein